jgi:type IV secretion system protein VirB10
MWDEIRTIHNISIDLSSEGTGTLGASGLSGEVDNHWGYRFGAAALLSLIEIGANYAYYKIMNDGNGTNNYYGGMGNPTANMQNMANTALQQFINIKPTLYKNHGDRVGVFVNKDIDFSQVYFLEEAR